MGEEQMDFRDFLILIVKKNFFNAYLEPVANSKTPILPISPLCQRSILETEHKRAIIITKILLFFRKFQRF